MKNYNWIISKKENPTVIAEYLVTIESKIDDANTVRYSIPAFWNGKQWICHEHNGASKTVRTDSIGDKVIAWGLMPEPFEG